MVKQSPKPDRDLLEDLIDKRLARIFGEDAEILVIYPLSSKKDNPSSDPEKKDSSDKNSSGVNEDD